MHREPANGSLSLVPSTSSSLLSLIVLHVAQHKADDTVWVSEGQGLVALTPMLVKCETAPYFAP